MIVNNVVCDECGDSAVIGGGTGEGWLSMSISFGYGTKADGDSFSANLCEACVIKNDYLRKVLRCYGDIYASYDTDAPTDEGKTLEELLSARV